MLQMVKLKLCLLLATLLSIASTYCYEDQRLPKVLVGDLDNKSGYYAATTNNQDIFVGGTTNDDTLRPSFLTVKSAVVTRMDAQTFTVIWSMIYNYDYDTVSMTNTNCDM